VLATAAAAAAMADTFKKLRRERFKVFAFDIYPPLSFLLLRSGFPELAKMLCSGTVHLQHAPRMKRQKRLEIPHPQRMKSRFT